MVSNFSIGIDEKNISKLQDLSYLGLDRKVVKGKNMSFLINSAIWKHLTSIKERLADELYEIQEERNRRIEEINKIYLPKIDLLTKQIKELNRNEETKEDIPLVTPEEDNLYNEL